MTEFTVELTVEGFITVEADDADEARDLISSMLTDMFDRGEYTVQALDPQWKEKVNE